MDLFKKIVASINKDWVKCDFCHELSRKKEIEESLNICPKCFYHFRISAETRVAITFDSGFSELYQKIEPMDFLGFKDTKGYEERLTETKKSTNRNDSVVCGTGSINGIKVLSAIFDFDFMGGSLGSVVGERITRLLEKGVAEKIPVIIFCASGGARVQEGILSLMQMSKVTSAIYRIKTAGIPYITVLTDPTLGGVSASIAMLGDIIIAEPKAKIGFAGSRVIEETTREKLPPEFQRAEHLFKHGVIDCVVPRKEIKDKLYNFLSLVVNI